MNARYASHLTVDQFWGAIGPLDEQTRLEALWARCEWDVPLFCAVFFPALCYLPFNEAHRWILEHLAELPAFEDRVEQGMGETAINVEAPRGLAKTTITKLVIVHRIVYGLERYVIWGAVGQREAEKETNHLRSLFTDPAEMFEEVYGPFKVAGGSSDWKVTLPDNTAVMVSARGWPRGKVRGSNDNGQRPTLIAGDDVEHPDEVRNPAVRSKLADFINSDVRNAGPKEGGLIYLQVGTRLHPDSQTARNAEDRAFTAVRFQAIRSWPDRMGLWQRCKELWADLSDPDRLQTARAFYERNKEAMDAGASVLDPVAQPLFALMQILWSRGEAAFWKDYLNDPVDPTRQVFFPDKWRRCTHDALGITTAAGRRVALPNCELAVWLDPRAAREVTRGDYAACALVARERQRHGPGYSFVLSCLMGRVKTEDQLQWLWAMFDQYHLRAKYGFEDNGFATLIDPLLDTQRTSRGRAGRAKNLPLVGYTSTENKEDRILSLAPRIGLGWIEWDKSLPAPLLDQFRQFPTGSHDDGPDAVERAIWLLDNGGGASIDMHASWSG